MNKIWVVTQQGVPIMAYNQSEVTPLELWDYYGVCSVYSLSVSTSINNEKEQSNEVRS